MTYKIKLALIISTIFVAGCDLNKKSKDTSQNVEIADWSCTSPTNVKEIERFAQQEYNNILDRRLKATDQYESDLKLLSQINSSLRFELKSITTTNDPSNATNKLTCSSQLVIHLPKGLQRRAENAYLEKPCEYECEHDEGSYTLQHWINDVHGNISYGQDKLTGTLNYEITKTDKEGLMLSVQPDNALLDIAASMTRYAVQFEAFRKANQNESKAYEEYEALQQKQKALALKAMQLRKSDLDKEQARAVERLNLTWDNLTSEQKEQLKSDQTEWFERRDVDCKVVSQKSIESIPEKERETYQQHYQYWDNEMNQINVEMQYSKCFIQKTNERIVYLNNVFN